MTLLGSQTQKASDFLRALKEKQEVWYKIMTTLAAPPRYYNPARRPSPASYRPPFSSQSKAFSYYQSQQRMPHTQLPWQGSEHLSGSIQPTTAGAIQCQYSSQPFRQTFIPQHQHYPANEQWYQQPLLLTGANCNTALRSGQITQSILRAVDSAANHPPAAPYQPIPR